MPSYYDLIIITAQGSEGFKKRVLIQRSILSSYQGLASETLLISSSSSLSNSDQRTRMGRRTCLESGGSDRLGPARHLDPVASHHLVHDYGSRKYGKGSDAYTTGESGTSFQPQLILAFQPPSCIMGSDNNRVCCKGRNVKCLDSWDWL